MLDCVQISGSGGGTSSGDSSLGSTNWDNPTNDLSNTDSSTGGTGSSGTFEGNDSSSSEDNTTDQGDTLDTTNVEPWWEKPDKIIFYINNENFVFNEKKDFKDTCNISLLKKIKTVDIDYMNKKKEQNTIKWYNPFKKIFLIEKTENKKIIKYEVRWIDEWITIE